MILADAYDLARGARINISTYMNLVEYANGSFSAPKRTCKYLEESDRAVWLQLSRHMKNIENLIAETEFVNIFKDFERSLLLPAYDRYAWNESAEPTLKVRLYLNATKKFSLNWYNLPVG